MRTVNAGRTVSVERTVNAGRTVSVERTVNVKRTVNTGRTISKERAASVERVIILAFAGVLLGLMLLCFFSVKASADESGLSRRTDAAETVYKSEIKDILEDYGMRNAGVTMTKTCFDGVSINYSVVIHISSYRQLNQTEKAKLLGELNSLKIAVDYAGVEFSFS